jgi:WD40 repeat protein
MSRADTDATNGWTDSIDTNTRNLKLSEFGNKNVALSIGEGNQGRVISCGYWDNSLKVHALDTLKEVVNSGGVGSGISGHMGEITCVQLGYKGGQLLITGGADGTCRVWVLESPSLVASLNPDRGSGSTAGLPAMTPMASVTQANASSAPQSSGSVSSGPATTPSSNVGNASGSGSADDALGANSELPVLTCVHILCGHSSPITAISYAPDPDIIFSASKDG